jgi:nitrite reductase (NO-forming)
VRWHLAANSGVAFWLVGLLGVSLAHRSVPDARWLLVHLLLLGAVSNAVLVWSTHFAHALLKNAPASRRAEAVRLVLLNAGVVVVVAGVLTDAWPVTVLGAVAVAGAVAAHGISLTLKSRSALPSRFGASVRYYVAASAALPVGAALGTVLARGLSDSWHGRVVVAHLAANVLGWVGLTVLGTLLTLWPTILRTRIADGAERQSRQALPFLVGSLVLLVAAALTGLQLAAAAGVLLFAAAAAWSLRPMLTAAMARPPQTYAAWSVLSAVGWLLASLVQLSVLLARARDWAAAGDAAHAVTVPLAAGFAAQVLLGALTYLVPVVVGGGPARVRATTAVLERGGITRVVVANLGLLVCVLPSPSLVRVAASGLVLVADAVFLVLVPIALRATASSPSAASPSAPSPATSSSATPVPMVPPVPRHVPEAPRVVRARHTGMAAAGLSAVVLAVSVGVALDPAALGSGATAASAGVAATGRTTTVQVEAKGMRFHPSSVDVPAGNRLVIEVTNRDDDVHDLALESGQHSGRLATGAVGRLEVPVVGRDLAGWCTIAGHRQMGMVFAVRATGAAAGSGAQAATGSAHQHGGHATSSPAPSASGSAPGAGSSAEAPAPDFMAAAPDGFRARDARLAPAPQATTHHVTLSAREVVREVAVGVRQQLWTFNGTAPGPTLRGRVGDRFVVTLTNDTQQGHGVDFHAGSLAPDEPMRTIGPGESHTFSFTATRSGIWMYHCSAMPMSLHIANGMFGAVVIDPPGLPSVDREYLLVQSELYLGPQDASADPDKVRAERPDAVVFNGFANQYDHDQLPVRVGERVRIWVLDAGPNRATSFHVVGGQFDVVFSEGGYLIGAPGAGGTAQGRAASSASPAPSGGAQALALQPAQGGFVELTPPQVGHYPFVSHVMVDAERGAHGVLRVVP